MSGVRRILFLLWRGLTSGGSTSFGAALVAVNFVTVCTGIVQFFADIDERLVVPRLRCLASELSYFSEFSCVLFPVGAIHGDGPAVLAAASRRQKKRRRFRDRHSRLIDRQPPRINNGAPLDIIESRGCGLVCFWAAGDLRPQD